LPWLWLNRKLGGRDGQQLPAAQLESP